MKYRFRLAPLLLLPIVVLVSGCNRARGDHISTAEEPLILDDEMGEMGPGTSSLDHRPLVMFGFMQPVGAMVTTNAHQPLLDYLTAETPYRYRVLFSTESERQVGVLEE
jgi:hypothetical protein